MNRNSNNTSTSNNINSNGTKMRMRELTLDEMSRVSGAGAFRTIGFGIGKLLYGFCKASEAISRS